MQKTPFPNKAENGTQRKTEAPFLRPMGSDSLLRPAFRPAPISRPAPRYEPNEEPHNAAVKTSRSQTEAPVMATRIKNTLLRQTAETDDPAIREETKESLPITENRMEAEPEQQSSPSELPLWKAYETPEKKEVTEAASLELPSAALQRENDTKTSLQEPQAPLWKAYEPPKQKEPSPAADAIVPPASQPEGAERQSAGIEPKDQLPKIPLAGKSRYRRLVEREELSPSESAQDKPAGREAAPTQPTNGNAGYGNMAASEPRYGQPPYSIPLTVVTTSPPPEGEEQQPIFLQPILYAAVNYPTPYSVMPITDTMGQAPQQPTAYVPGTPYPCKGAHQAAVQSPVPPYGVENPLPYGAEEACREPVIGQVQSPMPPYNEENPLPYGAEEACRQPVAGHPYPYAGAEEATASADEDTADERTEDAVPTAQMAQPVPVPLARLDFSAPSRRKWPWVLLSVLLVLAVAVGVLWYTGLLQKVPGLLEQWGITGSPQYIAATMIPLESAAPATQEQDGAAPTVTAFTAEPAQGIAPATVIFSVEGSSSISQVRLMDDLGLPLTADVSQIDEGKWICSAYFSAAYRGKVHVYISDAEGFWMDGGLSCEVSIE